MTDQIKTKVDNIRHQLEQVTPEMHPADYADTLANIVHDALVEAERICRLTGSSRPLSDIVAEITTVAAVYVPKSDQVN